MNLDHPTLTKVLFLPRHISLTLRMSSCEQGQRSGAQKKHLLCPESCKLALQAAKTSWDCAHTARSLLSFFFEGKTRGKKFTCQHNDKSTRLDLSQCTCRQAARVTPVRPPYETSVCDE
ncbi:hypothetical protein XENOCAPTIV_017841 [Xenoophorus captivus]|uniref:Uncharacterized protein n=1 Tax=Xenoophorus captivus TaxID=1517983 RepID=A0ABV0RMF4_9TELE